MEALCFLVVCPSVSTYLMCCNFSILNGQIAVKLDTNIHHVSGHYWKGLQGQRSEVKVVIVNDSLQIVIL